MTQKKLFPKLLGLCLLILTATSCGLFDTNELYSQLYGTWKCTYVSEHEVRTYASGETDSFDSDGPVTGPEHEDHLVIRFDDKRKMTVLEEGDPDEDMEYPATLFYWLKGNQIYGPAFTGEIVNYAIIDSVDDKTLIITLTEKGDVDDEYIDYTFIRTFEKVE